MTSKQTKRIAFLLAASLLMNTAALPVSAESDVAIVEEAPTEAPTEAPVEIVTEPPTEAPTAEAATEAPTEAVTEAPTEEATEAPTEEATEAPTEEATEAPTEEAPTEEATEAPTEEPTEPLTREDILAAQQEGYQQALSHFRSMDISDDRTMSLEWWCVMTGNVSMREPDYSILDAQEETGAPQEEDAEKTWADYIVFSEVISVRSASDLILLSYVSPNLYQNRTVTLFADAGNEFDLVHPLSVTAERTLNYRGLGDLGSPFSGIIRYAENSENITFVLDAPLFIGLSTKAKFLNKLDQPNTVSLVSKAGFAFDGLLARHILGEQQDEANWFIQLNAPDFTGGAVYVLPSLLGVLYGNANVNLLLTDNSCLSPSPRGYLCATMYAQSSLSAAGITRKLSVPVVGELSPDATLATDAPGEEVTEPTEEATEPTEEVTEPTEEVTEPAEEATEPTEETTEPTEEATEPTGEATEPSEEATEPSEEATEPTGEAAEPTGEATEPTEEATEPTEEATEPTEETTEPTEPAADDAPVFRVDMTDEEFQALVDYYLALPVVPGEMPLEWWFAVCGKLDDLRLYLTLKAEKEAAAHPVVLPAPSDVPPVVDVPSISAETETPAPTGASVQNEPIAFALESGDDGTVFSAEGMPAVFDSTEEAPVATEAAAETEAPTLPDVTEATEATKATEATEATEAPVNTETEGDSADDTPSGDDAVGASPQAAVNLKISTVDDLVTLSATVASDYQNETIIITASGGVINVTDTAFAGLGSDAFPFAGKIQYSTGSENATIVLNRALFNALSASANIANVNLTWAGTAAESDGAAILANNVYAGTNTAWNVTLGAYSGDTSGNDYRLPALIHTIRNGATVTLSAVNNSAFPFAGQGFFCDNLEGTLIAAYPEKLPTFNTAKDNVGGIVGTMAAGAALTVNAGTTAIVIDVATGGSTAGGLVGKMESGATLTVNADSITVNQVTAAATDGSNVGTLVGEATNPIVTELPAGIAAAADHIGLTGYNVGGLVGKLTLDGQSAQPPIAGVTGLILKGTNCGGLYGVLSNSVSFAVPAIQTFGYFDDGEFTPKITTSVTATHLSSGAGDAGSAGGVIGLYCPTSTDAAPVTLQFTDASTNVTVNKDNNKFANVGGMIGSVQPTAGSEKSYVSLSGVSSLTQNDIPALHIGGFVGSLESAPVHLLVNGRVVSASLDSEATGGLLGLADDNGHLVETSNDLTIAVANLTGTIAGGLVGEMKSGVLYLHNVPTLNITNIPSGASHGWIVGYRGNALVCSKEVLTPIATSNPDKNLNDTGIWGQVLQLSKFEDNLVTLDSANHNVSIRELPTKAGDYYPIGSLTDFASVALRLQLSPKGMMGIDSDISGGAINLTLSTNIDLTDTGLTGLTRDNSVGENYGFNIQGNGNTITLPKVKIFAAPGSHIFQGLIGQCRSGLTLNNLTVAGGSEIYCPNGQSTSVHCGIVGEMLSSATIASTNSSVSWTLGGWANNSNLSGFIGVTSVNNTIEFTDSAWTGSLLDISGTDGGVCRLGGFIANGFYDEGKKPSITVKNCTIGGTVQNTVSKDYDAAMGGLFGSLRYCQKLEINGLTVSTDFQSSSKKASGGLLGYELNCDDATFNGVVINGAKLTTDTKFGGLIYKGAGHWTVKGIHFQSATISGITDDKTPSGLLVSIGCSHKDVGGYEGLYLEVAHGAYKIDLGVTVSITGGGSYFDELVGRSIYDASSGRNGIVSIATENAALIDQNGCNTYQNQLNNWENPRTRYYYNLDTILTKADTDTTIDSPEEMVLWSAYNECRNCTKGGVIGSARASIPIFFQKGNRNKITGDINLSGYSFYPVAFDGTSIQNAAITFGFQQLEETENTAGNKKPSDSQRQHAGMHTGIFTGITTHSSVLTVNNLTLTGTVGGLNGEYGALVRGNVEGRLNTGDIKDVKDTVLNITGVTLNGIRVYPDLTNDTVTVAPLLIFRIGNYVTLRLTDVETTSGYAGISKAASSLIGKVGSSGNTTSIDLEFSKIQLTPPSSEADTDCKQRNCTLFTRALFLESFQYSTGCRGVYNFTSKEKYTIGKEVSNTTTGRNLEKQYWFFDEWGSPKGYVCGENNNPADSYKAYTRYVYQAEKPGAENYKELDVNLQPLDLTDGCGTYSDPYRITSGGALQELAKALSGGGSNPSWKVNISTAVLPNSSVSPNFSQDDGHTHEATADGQELVLVCGEKDKGWSIAADDTASDNDGTTVRATEAQMLTYLRNAYYMITEDITLPSDWAGLGTTANPFRGVIVGGGSATPTVAITTTTSAKQFGGLIRFSEGSVVKKLSIDYPASFTLTSDSNNILNYDSAVFFGGVVGCCKAGDTIVEDVTVALPDSLNATGNNASYAAIGGYVGLVGGANNQGGGGVVFRGSVSSGWQPNNNLYTNPYVGRVLDGYAVTEGSSFINGNGNYTIPALSTPSLTLTADTVTVGNADGLWLLSAMENSRHGGAYTNGKPRTHKYNTVGQTIPDAVKDDESGSGTQTNYYLWKQYDKSSLPTTFKLEFTGNCDMTAFGNGFRGIGVSQGTFRAYLQDSTVYPLITEIDGGHWTVTLAQNRTEPAGQYVDWAAMGVGLFPVLNAGENMVIQNLILTGTANLSVGDRANNITPVFHDGYQRTMVGAGMLAGALVNRQAGASITIQDVSASGSVVTNALMAGGLIGYCGSPVTKINGAAAFKKPASITLKGCNVSGVTVKASSIFGGFMGFGYANTITIEGCTATGITLAATGPQYSGKLWNYVTKQGTECGVGGIIGTVYQSSLNINGITLEKLDLSIPSGEVGKNSGLGGIVGSMNARGDGSLTNITMGGAINIYGDGSTNNPAVGGLIGILRNDNTTVAQLTISGVNIATAAGSTLSQRGYYDGGLIGLTNGNNLLLVGGAAENEAVRIGNAPGSVTISKGKPGYNGFTSGVVSSATDSLTITIQNLHLAGVTVNEAALSSLLFASGYGTTAITLKNSEFISCKLQQKGQYSGYLLGSSWGKTVKFNGFNIMLKDCTTNATGIFAGEINNNGSYMRLTAVSLVNCTGGSKDFYSGNDASYAIRANYTGVQGNQSSSSPWMDCNPLSELNGKIAGITSPIAGDGAAFQADGKTPIGTQIAVEKKYYNVTSAAEYFQDSGKARTLGISLAPFSTAGGNTGTNMPDFPVLVLPAVSKTEVNTAVYNYISLLTNFNSNAATLSGKLEDPITAKTYQWKGTQFEAISDSSITVDNGAIYTTPGKYDNTLNQFTLLTVSFKDPTDANNSYKLYIPIVVQKLLNYHFYASAISGTLYSRGTYETMESPVVTTHGDQVTVLLSYVYDNGKTGSPAIEEWQNSIDNGDNLLWNFDKTIVVAVDGNEVLPAGAKLTLVDRNNRDKVYYATYDGSGSIPLSSFTDAAGNQYVKNALCDAMGLKAEAADDGLFVQETDTAKATVRVGDTYYRPAADSEPGPRYSITVGNDTLLEEYYLTIQTSADSTAFSNVKIQCESSLKNETGDKTMLPNKFIEADSQHPYTRNNAENRILFGNFFEQTVTVTTATAEEISDANNTINATLTVAVNYKSDEWKKLFGPYAGAVKLYQRFELQASDWTGGTSASTSFTDRTATIRYLNGTTPVGSTKTTELGAEGIMVLKFPESVTVSTNTGLNAATLVAEVSLAYTPAQIQAQFDTRSNNTDGLQLWANSYLAYSQAALERSNNPTRGDDAKHFYRTESTPATLVYNANGTDMDARVNQLGVNGRVQDAASIDSVATYNVSVLDAAKNADTIHYSIELYAKDANGKFTQKIDDYSELLKVGDITATLTDRNGTEKAVKFGEGFTGGIDPSIPIRISLPLTVATGNGFTGTYANYQVELRVWLQNGDAQITGSEATDYIIYTNAKIKFPLVTSD